MTLLAIVTGVGSGTGAALARDLPDSLAVVRTD
jgi:hypothetical protein